MVSENTNIPSERILTHSDQHSAFLFAARGKTARISTLSLLTSLNSLIRDVRVFSQQMGKTKVDRKNFRFYDSSLSLFILE